MMNHKVFKALVKLLKPTLVHNEFLITENHTVNADDLAKKVAERMKTGVSYRAAYINSGSSVSDGTTITAAGAMTAPTDGNLTITGRINDWEKKHIPTALKVGDSVSHDGSTRVGKISKMVRYDDGVTIVWVQYTDGPYAVYTLSQLVRATEPKDGSEA